jgi:hypothetical protein
VLSEPHRCRHRQTGEVGAALRGLSAIRLSRSVISPPTMMGMTSDSLLRETTPLGERQPLATCGSAVDIVIPVRNEERDLGPGVRRLHAFLRDEFPFSARVLPPLTEDTGWFFDTELLVLAERAGLRIHEVPVDPGARHDPGSGAR